MAMICKYGGRECDGCQDCYEEPRAIRCPACGGPLDYGDKIYYLREGGDVLGCENCIGTKDADALEYL